MSSPCWVNTVRCCRVSVVPRLLHDPGAIEQLQSRQILPFISMVSVLALQCRPCGIPMLIFANTTARSCNCPALASTAADGTHAKCVAAQHIFLDESRAVVVRPGDLVTASCPS